MLGMRKSRKSLVLCFPSVLLFLWLYQRVSPHFVVEPELVGELMASLRSHHSFATPARPSGSNASFFSLVTKHQPIAPAPVIRQVLHSLGFRFEHVVILIDNQRGVISDPTGPHDSFGSADNTPEFAELMKSLAELISEGLVTGVALIDHSESSATRSLRRFFGSSPDLPGTASGFFASPKLCSTCTGAGFFIQQLYALQQCTTAYCAVFGSDILARRQAHTTSWVEKAIQMLASQPSVLAAVAPTYCNPGEPEWQLDPGFSDRYYVMDRSRFERMLPIELPSDAQGIVFEESLTEHFKKLKWDAVAWGSNTDAFWVVHPPDSRREIEAMIHEFKAAEECGGTSGSCVREQWSTALTKLLEKGRWEVKCGDLNGNLLDAKSLGQALRMS